jgi:hypothetical protein
MLTSSERTRCWSGRSGGSGLGRLGFGGLGFWCTGCAIAVSLRMTCEGGEEGFKQKHTTSELVGLSPPGVIANRSLPRATVSPAPTRIFEMTPETGAVNSLTS